MQFCAVYTNIKDGYNDKKYYKDLFSIFAYLTTSQAVRYIIIDRNNSFDQLCEEAIEDTEDFRISEVKIINSSKVSTLEKLVELQVFQRTAVTGNFVICDETTKNSIHKKIFVDHFIEIPNSNLYVACGAPLW